MYAKASVDRHLGSGQRNATKYGWQWSQERCPFNVRFGIKSAESDYSACIRGDASGG